MEVATLLAAVIGEKIKNLFSKVVNDFSEEVKHTINNKILEYQIEEYHRNFSAKTLLHRVQPKNLKDFYQPLFITPFSKKGYHHVNDSEKRIPTNCVETLFKKNQFITLVGNAGSGKSTVVKYLFLNSIDTKYKIPIKVELRYLNDYDKDVISFIKEKIFKIEKLATNEKIIDKLLSSGDFVIFLDGYDEITSTKKEKITREIDLLVKNYNKNCYLLTSRPYTEIDLLPSFHNFQVCELSDEDINQFIKKQIPEEEKELCDKIIEAVNSPENYSYKSFLSNPLLLSMFILTFQSYSSIPQKRSDFYSQVFDALYSVHDSMSKLAFVREKQSGLSKEQFIDVLKLFSFISYFDEKFIFNPHYLNEKLSFIKQKKPIVFDNDKLIADLQVAIGVLNKEGTDYTFPHRSLQEYFAAIYISSLNDDNKMMVYKKILASLTSNAIGRSSRENFYLLLSELDEKSLIEIALIPYFENFTESFDNRNQNSEIIISKFLEIHAVYNAFSYIIKSNELYEFMDVVNKQFTKYRTEYRKGKPNTQEVDDETSKFARNEVAIKDIQPFLIKFTKDVDSKKNQLAKYLSDENKSDKDIISLI